MKVKNLILSLVLVLAIVSSNVMPTYAEGGSVDPAKKAAFEKICKEFLSKTEDFESSIEASNNVLASLKQENKLTNDNVYSAYLELFNKGIGDCKTAAYALSKLFTEAGIRNRVLGLSYKNKPGHAVVCYDIDGCVEGETGLRIADFFEVKNFADLRKKAVKANYGGELPDWYRKFIFDCEEYPRFINMNVEEYFVNCKKGEDLINIESALPLASNEQEQYREVLPNINLPDDRGGWAELSEALKKLGINLTTDEEVQKQIEFDKAINEFIEKAETPEYSSKEAKENMLNEISARLKAIGIENKVKKVFGHNVISYEDNFRGSEDTYRVIDFILAQNIEKIDFGENITCKDKALRFAQELKLGYHTEDNIGRVLMYVNLVGTYKAFEKLSI